MVALSVKQLISVGETRCGVGAIAKGRKEIGDEGIDLSLSVRVIHAMPN